MTTTNTRQLTLTAATDALCTVLTTLQRGPVNYTSTSPIVADLERIAEVLLSQAERTDEEFAQILTLPPCVAPTTPIMPVALIQEAGNRELTSVERITNSGKVRTMKKTTNTAATVNTTATEKSSKPELGSTVTTPSGEGIVVAVYQTGFAAKVNGQIVTVLDEALVAAPVAAPVAKPVTVAPAATELPIKTESTPKAQTNAELLREQYEAAKAARLNHGGAAKTAEGTPELVAKASQPVKPALATVNPVNATPKSSGNRSRKSPEELAASKKAYWDNRKLIQREARSYGLPFMGTNEEIVARIAAAKAEGMQPVVKAPKAPKAAPVAPTASVVAQPTVTVAPVAAPVAQPVVVPVVAQPKPVAPVMVAAQQPATQPVLSTTVAAPAVAGSTVNQVSDLETVAKAIANSGNTVKLQGLCQIRKLVWYPTEGKLLLARKLAASGYRV